MQAHKNNHAKTVKVKQKRTLINLDKQAGL
jgi:hypothetical protein